MKGRGRREKRCPRRRKPEPRVPALNAETLEDFLNGRLEGEQRAQVIAILKDLSDDDFKVFTDATAALRQLEHEAPTEFHRPARDEPDPPPANEA